MMQLEGGYLHGDVQKRRERLAFGPMTDTIEDEDQAMERSPTQGKCVNGFNVRFFHTGGVDEGNQEEEKVGCAGGVSSGGRRDPDLQGGTRGAFESPTGPRCPSKAAGRFGPGHSWV